MGKEMLARLGKQTNVCVCPGVLLGAWWWLGEGGWGMKNKSVFLSQGPGSSRGFRRKCVDGEKEQNREKKNPMSGRNVSDSPDKTDLRSAPPH